MDCIVTLDFLFNIYLTGNCIILEFPFNFTLVDIVLHYNASFGQLLFISSILFSNL